MRFYRTLADERGGPVLDLGCGTGRLMAPLLRDGHTSSGVDRAPAMLARAAARIGRLGPAARRRALLVRADLRALAFRRRFAFAIAAFHSIQHLYTDADLPVLRGRRARPDPGGWLAFDTFAPDARFLARARRGRATGSDAGRDACSASGDGAPSAYSETYRLDGRGSYT